MKEQLMALDFKRRHYRPKVILMQIRWSAAYAPNYRDVQALAAERGLSMDHSTVYRWVLLQKLLK
jgi:transposase-like protein